MVNCWVERCGALDGHTIRGGGAYFLECPLVKISDCTFLHCHAVGTVLAQGGGIFARRTSLSLYRVTVDSSHVEASYSAKGGAIAVAESTVYAHGCTFTHCYASTDTSTDVTNPLDIAIMSEEVSGARGGALHISTSVGTFLSETTIERCYAKASVDDSTIGQGWAGWAWVWCGLASHQLTTPQ